MCRSPGHLLVGSNAGQGAADLQGWPRGPSFLSREIRLSQHDQSKFPFRRNADLLSGQSYAKKRLAFGAHDPGSERMP